MTIAEAFAYVGSLPLWVGVVGLIGLAVAGVVLFVKFMAFAEGMVERERRRQG